MAEEALSAWEITQGLKTRIIGRRLLYYPSLASTMEMARQLARQGAAEGTVIIADEQTAGRGRLKRAWLTPKGNIALSVILHPAAQNLPSLIMLASLAVVRSITEVTGLKPQIKWPNDVLLNSKKVSGILIENDFLGDKAAHSVIGIGIDVNFNPADYPDIAAIATSLSAELGREVSRLKLIRYLLVEMENLYLDLSAGRSLYEEWRDNLVTLGKAVRATADDAVYEGIAESVERDGSLMLRQRDGSLVKIVAGDVTLRV